MVRLVPMSQAEFEKYLEFVVPDYAQEHVRTGNWSAEKALQLAEEDFRALLPDGLATPNHYLFAIEDETLGKRWASCGLQWKSVKEDRELLSMTWKLIKPIVVMGTARRR